MAPEVQLETASYATTACDMFALGSLICAVYNCGNTPIRAAYNLSTYASHAKQVPDDSITLKSIGNYSAILNHMKLVHWPLMCVLLHLVRRGGKDWAGPQPPRPLIAVSNATAHSSTAGVPITVLLYLTFCGPAKKCNLLARPWVHRPVEVFQA